MGANNCGSWEWKCFCAMIALVFFVNGCHGFGGKNSTGAVSAGKPRVSGVNFTTEWGELYCVYGQPSHGDMSFGWPICYPVPFNDEVLIDLALPPEVTAHVSIVAALGPNEPDDETQTIAGAGVRGAFGAPVRAYSFTAPDECPYVNCRVWFTWDGTTEDGTAVQDGFYRVYLTYNGRVNWTDILLARNPAIIPKLAPSDCFWWWY